jgi:hypothetical protein
MRIGSHPGGSDVKEEIQQPAVPKSTPIFSILAAVCLMFSLGAPLILITLPLMVTAVFAIIGMVRKEHPRFIAPIALAGAVLLFFMAGSSLSNIRGTSSANLSAATIDDWSWQADPEFGTNGTIKWRVVVRNTSDKPVESAKVEFSTYDQSGKILTSTFSYVNAIPPGGTRTDESYADYYGTEKTARADISEVRFGGS